VAVQRDGEQAIVSVRDQGEGIPLSEQDRVFERFHRVESGMARRTGGTGLGLYIAKRLVEAMGGRLWLVSRQEEGSTFSFSLPLAEAGSLYSAAAAVAAQDPSVEVRPANGHPGNGSKLTGNGRPVLLP
jgi:K+-sensing histidine kinase KdpD